ncbi:MAG: ABC transporter permease [Gammaproteobacteria bacterium]|nr:ABC transporter permease [Gammaproteobacteria bacterium]
MVVVLVNVFLTSVFIVWSGAPVGKTFVLLMQGGFGSLFALTETLTRATPLIFTGLAVAVAFKAKFYNIGAEGQLYLGALATVAVGSLPTVDSILPTSVWFGLMLLAGFLAGAMILLFCAWLKAYLGVDEVVTTLLLNFIILLFVSMMLNGPMKDPSALGWPQSMAINGQLELTKLIAQTRLHTGLLLALAAALLCWILLKFTVLGLSIRSVGANPNAARFMGLPVLRTVLLTSLLSGGLAGLAGVVEVAGRTGYVTLDMSPGYGMTGVIIALLVALNPLGVIVAAIFVAGVLVGADSMSRAIAVPTYLADLIVSMVLLTTMAGSLLLKFKLVRRKHM